MSDQTGFGNLPGLNYYKSGVYCSGASGPIGNPKTTQIISKMVQIIKKATEYGNIVAMTVPIPALLSYRCTKATINAKYDIMGEIMLVILSPIR